MKKLTFILPSLLILVLTHPVFAINPDTSGQKADFNPQAQQPIVSPSSVSNQAQKQRENSQLQVNIQEQETTGDASGAGSLNRSQTALTHMSEVAKKVQELLQLRTTGGIGEQIRLIAREQNQAQTQIQEHINKLDSKGKFARLMTGTDTHAVDNIKSQLVQNQSRIKQLENLQNQLTNKSDIAMVQETIEALIQENSSLQERITSEEQTKSLFGWIFRFFAK